MAQYPTFTKKDFADFLLIPEAEVGGNFEQAVKQATFLFKMGTCLSAFPDDDFQAELATYGIFAMADALMTASQYREVLTSPFQSESIGSYSYSKIQGLVQTGQPVGVAWFDQAVGELSVCHLIEGGSAFAGGGIEVFEHDGRFVGGARAGNARLLGPGEDYLYVRGPGD